MATKKPHSWDKYLEGAKKAAIAALQGPPPAVPPKSLEELEALEARRAEQERRGKANLFDRRPMKPVGDYPGKTPHPDHAPLGGLKNWTHHRDHPYVLQKDGTYRPMSQPKAEVATFGRFLLGVFGVALILLLIWRSLW